MTKIFTLMMAGLLLLSPTYSYAQAGRNCAAREVVVSRLAEKYSETRQNIGLAGPGVVMETYASPTGTWTIVMNFPNGVACLIASGQAYENLEESLPNTDDDT